MKNSKVKYASVLKEEATSQKEYLKKNVLCFVKDDNCII